MFDISHKKGEKREIEIGVNIVARLGNHQKKLKKKRDDENTDNNKRK